MASPRRSPTRRPTAIPAASNDSLGNNPNNPVCENFVLPLISGVPGGWAQLASNEAAIFPAAMNLGEPDPAKQNWTDLNVRRASGDLEGYIGSPPDWTGTPSGGKGSGPKPARAYWVSVKGSDGRVNSRYAFWMDDESFRVNGSLASPLPSSTPPLPPPALSPPDNLARPVDLTGKFRSLQPSDLMLIGTLTKAADSNPSGDATNVVTTRASYPGAFFPDPLSFSHAFDGYAQPLSTATVHTIDSLRYLTTNQSGTLNLTRHGSQRLNLNSTIPSVDISQLTAAQIGTQVNELVQTMEFHLPYFGERFYRTNKAALNDATQVPGSPKAPPPYPTGANDNSLIYYYKVAANLRDYVDTDSQPTIIMSGGGTGQPCATNLAAGGSR